MSERHQNRTDRPAQIDSEYTLPGSDTAFRMIDGHPWRVKDIPPEWLIDEVARTPEDSVNERGAMEAPVEVASVLQSGEPPVYESKGPPVVGRPDAPAIPESQKPELIRRKLSGRKIAAIALLAAPTGVLTGSYVSNAGLTAVMTEYNETASPIQHPLDFIEEYFNKDEE